MSVLWLVLYYICFAFFILLCVRVVLQLIQQLSPQWRPSGVMVVVFETVFSITDPPLRALGRVIPPLRLGSVMFDLAFLVVMLVTVLLMNLFMGLHASSSPALSGMGGF